MTTLRQAAEQALDKIDLALAKVAALCDGTERWTMSVPARLDRDPDLVIAAALIASRESITALRSRLAQPERHISYVCPQCAWTLDTEEKLIGLKGENAVLLGLLVDASAIIKTIDAENTDEADKLADLLRAIDYALDPYRHKGALL